eukprot:888277-Pelagomonas_calceolata.AAC.3
MAHHLLCLSTSCQLPHGSCLVFGASFQLRSLESTHSLDLHLPPVLVVGDTKNSICVFIPAVMCMASCSGISDTLVLNPATDASAAAAICCCCCCCCCAAAAAVRQPQTQAKAHPSCSGSAQHGFDLRHLLLLLLLQ